VKAIGSAVPRSKEARPRLPVGFEYEKSLCPGPQRIPFSFRAENTLAAVRLHPAEAVVEGGRAGGLRPRPVAGLLGAAAPIPLTAGAPDPSPEFINQRTTPLLDEMKLKARINGEKVHDVGYRVFLLDLALELGIERFAAYNRIDGGLEMVSVMAEGDDDQIAAFRELIASKRPKDARVSDVTIEDYDGRIVSTTDFMHIIQVQQLNKGIPAILRIQTTQEKMLEKQCMMLDKQDQMLDKQDTTISILKNIKEDTSEIGAIKEEVSTARYEARREREEIISTLKSGSLEEKYEQLSREIAEIKAAISEIKGNG